MEFAITSLMIVIILQLIAHQRSDIRKDKLISELTDKIKAKDFTEYVEQTKPPQTFEPVTNNDKELYWKEIEESKV